MSDNRSIQAHFAWQGASEKFDYFMAGLPAALAAFVGRDLRVAVLGLNATTLELLALVAFALSFVFALKRLEVAVTLMRLNAGWLEHHEAAQATAKASTHGLVIDVAAGQLYLEDDLIQASRDHQALVEKAEATIKQLRPWAPRHYKARNALLLVGVGLLALSRAMAALHTVP
ncbi:MAG: hypothetical protein Q8K82_25955 [Gemmatimonadaceae bacterium]|nr:hypothetical protein [Gemmatimonadaceae bacterium]